jgi:hypothetical protein
MATRVPLTGLATDAVSADPVNGLRQAENGGITDSSTVSGEPELEQIAAAFAKLSPADQAKVMAMLARDRGPQPG